jgi:hypothetical protein
LLKIFKLNLNQYKKTSMIFQKKLIGLLAVAASLGFIGCGNSSSSVTNDLKLAVANDSIPANAIKDALPYTLEFVEKTYPGKKPLPCLQSYLSAVASDGSWLVMAGRRQGLHTFKSAPAKNFVPDSSNNYMFVINPQTGDLVSFDVNTLSPALSAPLQATNLQSYFDEATGKLYIVGGYGWKADKSDMVTFNTIMGFKVDDMVAAIKSGASVSQITALFEISQDDRFAVTGGELFKMGGNFYLVFGQRFDGQYRAFGGSDFTQKYTEEVRVFNLVPNSLKINSYGATTNTESDHPFHRRDGNTIEDIDPVTGKPRITAFGGVFQPGVIGAYTYPIYINSPSAPILDRKANQKFSQYECPVISVYDSANTHSVYRTFFGGIGHYYYYQTPAHKAAYDTVTKEGRNDGFPFVEDISTFLESADGTYKEFIHIDPLPGNRLIGAATSFILNPLLAKQGMVYSNGVIKLAAIPAKTRLLIGYIYGGIEAQNPLPLEPNTGTFVSNSVFEVYLNYVPSAAIPASEGHESTKSEANINRK